MKLKALKYNIKLGMIALAPMLAPCAGAKTATGVVVAKEAARPGDMSPKRMLLDLDGDSVPDIELIVRFKGIKTYLIWFGVRAKMVHYTNTRLVYDDVNPGDTIVFVHNANANKARCVTHTIDSANGHVGTALRNAQNTTERLHNIRGDFVRFVR